MTRTPLLLAIVAAAALAGCSNQDQNAAAEENSADANAGVELPPAIAASKSYRCGDNTVIQIDWLSDNKTANVRTEQNGAPTQVTAPEPGQPMTSASGLALEGTVAGPVTVTLPGGASKSCHV
ncbi:MAG TPA: hypothetical protein VFU87_00520 [Sphingomicrobium sp.]|nr:hypothetical protein [Sphingomicrobium sp.]